MKKKFFVTKVLCGIVMNLLAVMLLTGCGYTYDELKEMGQYKKQGEINALNYVKEKYAFDTTVEKVVCEKTDGGGDISPPLSGNVYVTLKHNEETFVVHISGEEATTLGIDNYQYEDIKSALEAKLYTITNLPAEEFFLSYGKYTLQSAMIATYFDGNNLMEIFEELDSPPAVVVSYINQDIAGIDIEAVKEQTGIEDYLFVDYDSKEHYDTIKNPFYNIGGTPLNWDIESNLPYVNQYLMTGLREDIYVNCEKQIIDDIILITENADQQITLEKKKHPWEDASNKVAMVLEYANRQLAENQQLPVEESGKEEQVYDTYVLNKGTEIVHIYVPLEKLYIKDYNPEQLEFEFRNKSGRLHTSSRLTDDGKYIGATLYTNDYGDIEFAVILSKY